MQSTPEGHSYSLAKKINTTPFERVYLPISNILSAEYTVRNLIFELEQIVSDGKHIKSVM